MGIRGVCVSYIVLFLVMEKLWIAAEGGEYRRTSAMASGVASGLKATRTRWMMAMLVGSGVANVSGGIDKRARENG